MKNYMKMYIWAVKASYNFMQGQRNIYFWAKLPFKAHYIAWNSI